MREGINDFLALWEPIWLFLILFIETLVGAATLTILIKEYKYDEQKDIEKKQKKTRTTKKVTENKDGGKVTEETVETEESSAEKATEETK